MLFGIFLSAFFLGVKQNKKNVCILLGGGAVSGLFFLICNTVFGSLFTEAVYPIFVHLPLFLLLVFYYRFRWLPSIISIMTAYLCCQLRRWAALLVIALFPAGGTVLQDATELIVTLPILLVLIRWIAPSVRALSRSPLLLQLQFGIIPLLSYLFDYFTRIYTDLLSSGNQAAVEFMPFVCSLAYLGFVLHTTQEQQLLQKAVLLPLCVWQIQSQS